MSLSESFVVVSFTLFSFADLRYRLVPGIELFFLGTILIALPVTPLHVSLIVLACLWGLLRYLPYWLAIPLLFYPPAWPGLLTGYGYRKVIIGRADLLAISGLACLLPLTAVLLALIGLEVWRRFWVRRRAGSIPALPGLLLGILLFFLVHLIFPPL
jgi:hypothetical protein